MFPFVPNPLHSAYTRLQGLLEVMGRMERGDSPTFLEPAGGGREAGGGGRERRPPGAFAGLASRRIGPSLSRSPSPAHTGGGGACLSSVL